MTFLADRNKDFSNYFTAKINNIAVNAKVSFDLASAIYDYWTSFNYGTEIDKIPYYCDRMEILAKEENLTYADTKKIYNTWA